MPTGNELPRDARCAATSVSRTLAQADVDVVSVDVDYEYDRSRWSAGPRRAVAVNGLRASLVCRASLGRTTAAGPALFARRRGRGWLLWSALIEAESDLAAMAEWSVLRQRAVLTRRGLSQLRTCVAFGDVMCLGDGQMDVTFRLDVEAW